jgi:adenylosuccinate synthase
MLLDVLTGIDELKVAVAYERGGKRTDELPSSLSAFAQCRPVYETLPGWSEDVSSKRAWSELPVAARNYVELLGRRIAVPVTIVSVGPERRQTVLIPPGEQAR